MKNYFKGIYNAIKGGNNFIYFGYFFALLLLLYAGTYQAGWVTDTIDWQQKVRDLDLWSFLNLIQTRIPSLYQFTQLITWILYKLLGQHYTAWWMLFIILQSFVAILWFTILKNLLLQAQHKSPIFASLIATTLFCICPHISEVLVWKACYHYLQGLIIMLLIIRLVQLYWVQAQWYYVFGILFLFACSTFSLEVFYLTPWMVLTLLWCMAAMLPGNNRKAMLMVVQIVLPMLLIFLGHLALLRIQTGHIVSHLGNDIVQPVVSYLRKSPTYIFHIVALGRFWPQPIRQIIYSYASNTTFLVIYYACILMAMSFAAARFGKLKAVTKVLYLLLFWVIMAMILVSPVWIPDSGIVAFDRYAYIMLPFIIAALVLLLLYIRSSRIYFSIIMTYLVANVLCTFHANKKWGDSAALIAALIEKFPIPNGSTVLLLNMPDNYDGIPVIGAMPNSNFKQMYELSKGTHVKDSIYDVLGYNLLSCKDGAQAKFLDDSTLEVTLLQWGTWWWYKGFGAYSYQNNAYRVELVDPGHRYLLHLKRPRHQYLILTQVGPQWQRVL